MLAVTGDADGWKKNYLPIYDSIASVYSDLLYLNTSTQTYMLSNATDPDEFANFVDNPGYTMVLAKTHLENAKYFSEAVRYGRGSKMGSPGC